MSYLYLNYIDNLNSGSRNFNDFFSSSLQEQYNVLKRKIGRNAPDNLQEFVERCFPSNQTADYYISMPAFDRETSTRIKKDGSAGNQYIDNVVIRPDLSDMYRRNLSGIPVEYDLILIGDIIFGNLVFSFKVKGIDLIDSGVAKFGEYKISCTAANAFATIKLRSGIDVPDYRVRELNNPILTHDFIDRLCFEVYPIPHPEKAIKTFDDWSQYLAFRRYYLGVQSSRCEEISHVSVKHGHMVASALYKKNREAWCELLLDGHEEFSRGEQIVLSRDVAGSDDFPLICVEIEKNRKSVLKDTVGRGTKGKPKYEVHLRRYSRESMGLSPTEPKYDENGNLPKGFRFFQYSLGERFTFTFTDVPPDCTAITKQYEKKIDTACAEVDHKYRGIINADLEKFMLAQTPLVQTEFERKYHEYCYALDANLAKDIEENLDKEIHAEYEKAVIAPIEKQYTARIKEAEKKCKAAKKSKDPDKAEKAEDELRDLSIQKEQSISDACAICSIAVFYEGRNKKRKEQKKKSTTIEMQAELSRIKKDKQAELEYSYQGRIEAEKADAKEQIQKECRAAVAEKVENETIRRYEIYFRPENLNDSVKDIEKDLEKVEGRYLTYDNRAEKAKIERQEKALAAIKGGYVKNPYLAGYLFSPESLAQSARSVSDTIDWCLESLNETQKLAVRRALSSESIFLLQGPPGTGKTQVIAEITAQLTKQGKKILISSETHKAIDNVFERLPKIPEIRPLRLIPSQSGKESHYSPERLVDNFYLNIEESLRRQIDRFEHFNETKETFSDEMKSLRFDYDRLLRLNEENARTEAERKELIRKINQYNSDMEQLRGCIADIREEIEAWNITQKYIESYRFDGDDAKDAFIREYTLGAENILAQYSCFAGRDVSSIGNIVMVDIAQVRSEIGSICGDDRIATLERKKEALRNKLQCLRDPDTDEAPAEGSSGYAEYKKTQKEFIAIGNEIKALKSAGAVDITDSVIAKLVSAEILADKEKLLKLPEQIASFRMELTELITTLRDKIERECSVYRDTELSYQEKLSEKQRSLNDAKARHEELSEDEGISEYEELNSSLKQKISRFFRNFGIIREYDPSNLDSAFTIIAEEWHRLETDYRRSSADNKVKIPMFKDICKYLESGDILEEDRQNYTRALFDNVNVFGITCTSRDRFTKTQLEELGRYGIESVDIRTQGIDVVIIDEVSKSSFLDLLIPILYGKTVILVGDHRQLPPMYDLRHMKESDFEDLDPKAITKKKNDSYTAMYEECFFKTLYERVPEDFRVMLNKQYRCHSHIMEVFNHFYGGAGKGLTVGRKQQDDEKRHGLTARAKGNIIVDPDHHIYFVDCNEKESSEEGSTSKVNKQEAEVVMELLTAINAASCDLVDKGKLGTDRRTDERPSVGVICTYGDQAGLIKKRRKGIQYKGFSQKDDERLIISTVDDFQGDERDVIIVSMVRNPKDNRYNAEFVKQFERINVAFSRARKLLIIVGSKTFLSEQTIDLPDLTGDKRYDKTNFPVYREIIDTIALRGRLWTAEDIIGG